MFWEYPSLTSFWGHIFETFLFICHKTIEPNQITDIFGVSNDGIDSTTSQSNCITVSQSKPGDLSSAIGSQIRPHHLQVGSKKCYP